MDTLALLGLLAPVLIGVLFGFGGALAGLWLGRRHAADLVQRLHAEVAGLRDTLQVRDRDLGQLRAKRETQLAELQQEIKLVEARRRHFESQIAALSEEKTGLEARLAEERATVRDRIRVVDETSQRLEAILGTLATEAQALEREGQGLEALLAPLHTSLEKYDQELQAMERVRSELHEGIRDHLLALAAGRERLRASAGSLLRALAPDRLPGLRAQVGDLRKALEPEPGSGPSPSP